MLAAQHLAKTLVSSHPSHAVVTAPHGPRDMKETLSHKHFPTVQQYLVDGVMRPEDCKEALKDIHTKSVAATIASLTSVNDVLGEIPPIVADSEKSLNPLQRRTLSQLRSGSCKLLNDYKMLLGHVTSATCPECRIRRHTPRHLFECDAAPTNLGPRDLWTNPRLVVDFLRSLPSFSTIFPPDPPPPPPPN